MIQIVAIKGKQYIVKPGSKLRVHTVAGEVGSTVADIKPLATLSDTGIVLAPKSAPKATITAHGKGKKIDILKHNAKKRYRRNAGHRQGYTDITFSTTSDKKA